MNYALVAIDRQLLYQYAGQEEMICIFFMFEDVCGIKRGRNQNRRWKDRDSEPNHTRIDTLFWVPCSLFWLQG
ncbi:MAG: hypothetical protein CSA52_00240 [Gammaproteobacteria bacterium]|nr:MAG: hypothetical protein CSB48_02145 [Pseudomonadota bacterium]PIE39009.1 MAG: hypothetical protein CSA52_00240 [Gammaproteobacteria bacterium]